MASKASEAEVLLQLKIELTRTEPVIWRRLVVPASITLARLHDAIQVAMGWEDCHMHQFEIGDQRYVPSVADSDFGFGDPPKPTSRARLAKCLAGLKTFRYTYDFGDNWIHKIKVEKTLQSAGAPAVQCTGGANACPPEDIGGVWGYAHFLQVIADPSHPEHEEMLEWHDGPLDPSAFDLAGINARLLSIGAG